MAGSFAATLTVMTRRDTLRDAVTSTLRNEVGEVSMIGSEMTEVLEYTGDIDGRTITVIVTKYPEGENPGAYDGAAGWTVDLKGEDGNSLDRFHNPERSLDDAFRAINWDNVRERLRRA